MKKIENDLDIIAGVTDVKGKRFIDVGCGTGDLVRELAAAGAGVTGIDSAAMIEKAKAFPTEGDEDYLVGGGEALPVPNGSADVVVFLASLHHVPEAEMDRAAGEARRVLKPGGVVIFGEPVSRDGSYTELIRLVEDEARIQQLAHEVIKGTIKKGVTRHVQEMVYFERSLRDFKDLLDKYVDDKKEREDYYARANEVTARLSRETGVPADAFRFKSICRIDILQFD